MLLSAAIVTVAGVAGCVERTISIDSEPDGALVWLNDREIGRTPVEVEFVHYGVYDVRLQADGYEPLVTSGVAAGPWWDSPPFDFFAEVSPSEADSRIEWFYQLEPVNDDVEGLKTRAAAARSDLSVSAPVETADPVE